MSTLRIEINLLDEASIAAGAATLARLATAFGARVDTTGDAGKPTRAAKPKPEAAAPSQPAGTATEAASSTASQTSAPASAKAETDAPTVTRDDAAKAIVELNKKKGRPAAIAVLEKFRPAGYTEPEVKLPVVAKEDYAALVAAAKKALAE